MVSFKFNKLEVDQLNILRKKIDNIDKEIIQLLVKRLAIVAKIAKYKKGNNMEVLQKSRWGSILRSRKAWADRKKISKTFIENIFRLIHCESMRIQLKYEKAADGKG